MWYITMVPLVTVDEPVDGAEGYKGCRPHILNVLVNLTISFQHSYLRYKLFKVSSLLFNVSRIYSPSSYCPEVVIQLFGMCVTKMSML